MAFAAVEVALTLALLPWRWGDYFRAHGAVAVYMTLLFAGHGASAVLLLWAGRQDRRTWLLGGYFLFKTTVAPLHMLPAFWGQMPSVDMLQSSVWDTAGPTRAFLLLCAYPLAFAVAPAFLWAFARECPRVHRRTRLDDLARRMVPVSVALGGVMCGAVAAVYWAGTVGSAVNDRHYVRGSRRGHCHPECAVPVRGGGHRAARPHGAGRGEAAGRPVQRRLPDVDGSGDGVRHCRGVHAGVLAVELRVGVRSPAGATVAISGNAPALVLGARRTRAHTPRGGPGGLPAAAVAPRTARRDGRGAGGGAGLAARQQTGAGGRLGPCRPARDVAAGRGRNHAAGGPRARAASAPPGCVDRSRVGGPAGGTGRSLPPHWRRRSACRRSAGR